jgi:methylase of polypeptide subunit release factors
MRSQKAEEILSKVRERETPYDLTLADITVTVLRDVYPTGELSSFVIECLSRDGIGIGPGKTSVLDYGTGTGYLAVAAAKLGASKVVALDINPAAVECATINAERHGFADRIEVRQSNELSALLPEERFDMVVAGMPFEAAEVDEVLERSVYDPGFAMRTALFSRAVEVLNPGGRIFTTYSKRVQDIRPIESFEPRLACTLVHAGTIRGELNYVYMLKPREGE